MRLIDVCKIQIGYTPRGRLEAVETGGVPAIQLRDLSAHDRIDSDRLSRFDLGELAERYLVRPGDVLFRSRGERNTALATDERLAEPAVAVMPLIVLRPNRKTVEPRFLEWVLNQKSAQRFFDSRARGTRLRMIPKSTLDNLEIDIPDLATQRVVVEIDDLAEREQELSLLVSNKRRQLVSLLLNELTKKTRSAREHGRKAK